MRPMKGLGLTLLVAVVGGCATVGPASGRDPASVRQEIQRTLDEHARAFERGDAAALATIYTDDALVAPANAGDLEGRTAVQAVLAPVFTAVTFSDVAYQVRDVSVLGDTAFTFVTWSGAAAPRGQAPVQDRGRCSLVWVRQPAGSWMIRRSHCNSSLPAASATAAIAGAGLREAVEEAGRRHTDAWKRGDADAAAAMYTDDALLMFPSMETVRGRAAIHAFVGSVFSTTRIDRLDVTTEELDVHGDTAYERGTYSEAYTVQGQGAKQERGRYILVWKRQLDGAWKIHRFLGNRISPPA
jgi:uncharacterized protein (TIGR02246 family)